MVGHQHPVLATVAVMEAALKDVSDIDPVFMRTPDKAAALLALSRVASQVEELHLRLLTCADDVADEDGARDPASWLAFRSRSDPAVLRRDQWLGRLLERRFREVGAAMRQGRLNRGQAEVVVRSLAALPDALDPEILGRAEERLVAAAEEFAPRQLRMLGRRILEVVAPEVAEEAERRALEDEEARASRATSLVWGRRGDGTTDLRLRVADAVADRLFTYLEAFASPRRAGPDDRRPYDQRLGHAFGAFLESVDSERLPLHGGDATTVIVTVDLDDLRESLGAPGVALVGDEPITAAQARRLACTAKILPAVLGGESQLLDLGRARRLFTPTQRKAMAVRDQTCRAEGCDIPAAWCEAHHAALPWSRGGRTDLADGALLCSHHHHRAHDSRYDARRLPDGGFRFHRRT